MPEPLTTAATFIGLVLSVALSATILNLLASKRIKDLETRLLAYVDAYFEKMGIPIPVLPDDMLAARSEEPPPAGDAPPT